MHALGLKPDRHDRRDLAFSVVANQSLAALVLPPSVDLRPLCSPVRDQGHLGSCTGFASVTGFRECLLLQNKQPFVTLSPLYEYYWERVKEHSVDVDSGATIRDAMKVLVKFGAATETAWPYDITRFRDRPPQQVVDPARLAYPLLHYHRVHNHMEIKQALALNRPVVIGIEVWESFESPEVAASGVVPLPNTSVEQFLGGHAVCVVGYADAERRFLVKNSWGTGWGMQGYFTLPYDFFRPDLGLVMDMWTGSTP